MREPIYHETLQEVQRIPVELPTVTGPVADTETSHPFNAANRQLAPLDLAAYGYVEEEYFVSGYANVYEYHDVGLYPKIRCENGQYCTRILVRRPATPQKQSDFAIVEIFNYAGAERAFAGWGYSWEYILSRGDVWVGITIKQSAVEKLKTYDPERYAPLGFPNPVPKEKRRAGVTMMGPSGAADASDYENGLAYDAMSQVAALLKSKVPQNPLYRNGVSSKAAKYVLGLGASGCDLSLYCAALQNLATMDGKRPCFDGHFIHMTGYPGYISNGETRFEADDDRCKIMTNVPLVWTQTMGDMRGGGVHPSYSYMYRWPDSDLPGRQHRQYEIACAALGNNFDVGVGANAEDLEKYTGQPPAPVAVDTTPDEELPFQYVMHAVLDNLKKWVKDGVPAPKSAYIEMAGEYPDADFVLDEHGNAKGGIRFPQVEVPTKTYTWHDQFGRVRNEITPFSAEKLKALYPTHADYYRKFVRATMKMVQDGYLLAEDAEKMLLEAYEARIPD